ncbi:hypothetical protein H5410_027691 [Solanum commersonii]|uniref:Uncharacterized protein n=1 Tax=Solanum commersonii TaxID=4109 RepID=A0A9J5Z2S4_SOLCO|nr:hypothetical protein H5410_027691 [Solanum commersonii]
MCCEGSLSAVSCMDDPPFGLPHCLLALAFSIFAFWIIGRYSTTSQNCSVTHLLLPFIADMIFFLQGSTHWNFG